MKKKLLSAGLCLLAAVVWGTAFKIQEIASVNADKIDAFFFGGIRFLLGGLILIPLWFVFEKETDLTPEIKAKKHKSTIIYGIITGAVLFVASALQQFGIQLTGESGKAGFITGMYLIFVPIASLIIFRQKASPLVWGAVAFSFVGLYFLCLNGGAFSIKAGDVLVFLCAIFFTAHIIVIDRFIGRVSALRYSSVQFITVGVLNLLTGTIFGHITWEGFVATLFPIIYCGVMSTGVAYTCQIIGQKFTPPTIAALLFSTEGLFSVIFESIVERRVPSGTMLIGCALMFVGIILSQIPDPFKKFYKSKQSDTTQEIE
jgi:drug/metabolite transporter (DMT)-like permease